MYSPACVRAIAISPDQRMAAVVVQAGNMLIKSLDTEDLRKFSTKIGQIWLGGLVKTVSFCRWSPDCSQIFLSINAVYCEPTLFFCSVPLLQVMLRLYLGHAPSVVEPSGKFLSVVVPESNSKESTLNFFRIPSDLPPPVHTVGFPTIRAEESGMIHVAGMKRHIGGTCEASLWYNDDIVFVALGSGGCMVVDAERWYRMQSERWATYAELKESAILALYVEPSGGLALTPYQSRLVSANWSTMTVTIYKMPTAKMRNTLEVEKWFDAQPLFVVPAQLAKELTEAARVGEKEEFVDDDDDDDDDDDNDDDLDDSWY